MKPAGQSHSGTAAAWLSAWEFCYHQLHEHEQIACSMANCNSILKPGTRHWYSGQWQYVTVALPFVSGQLLVFQFTEANFDSSSSVCWIIPSNYDLKSLKSKTNWGNVMDRHTCSQLPSKVAGKPGMNSQHSRSCRYHEQIEVKSKFIIHYTAYGMHHNVQYPKHCLFMWNMIVAAESFISHICPHGLVLIS